VSSSSASNLELDDDKAIYDEDDVHLLEGWDSKRTCSLTLRAKAREELCAAYGRGEVDLDFAPYLARINALPHAATLQCCCGHMLYTARGSFARRVQKPKYKTNKWGYLGLALRDDALAHLVATIRRCSWLWKEGSVLGLKTDRMAPADWRDPNGVPLHGWSCVAVAWDAKSWPRPAVVVTTALEAFGDGVPHPQAH
jgi:hypothetical protein